MFGNRGRVRRRPDLDASWWDPVGEVDASSSDAMNAVDASITLTSPATAVLTTARGFRVALVRHPGATWLPGCD